MKHPGRMKHPVRYDLDTGLITQITGALVTPAAAKPAASQNNLLWLAWHHPKAGPEAP
jgi:hypothetical protein